MAGPLAQLRGLLALVVAVAVLGVGCSAPPASSGTAARGSTRHVVTLTNIEQLSARFNEDVGKVRLILLISPT